MKDLLLGALTVLVTTNFVGVSFTPIPCPHPGCAEGRHSFTATEKYMIVRETWAEVMDDAWKHGARENYRLYSDTNEWGSLSHPIAHPSVYFMHTQPGWAVRPGTRWPLDMPPLPPWEAYEARRGNVTVIPPDPQTIQAQLRTDAEMDRKLRQRFGAPTNSAVEFDRSVTTNLPGDSTLIAFVVSTNVLSRPAFTFSSNYTSAVNPNEIEITFQSTDGTRWTPTWTKEEPTNSPSFFFSPDDSGTGFYKNSSNVLSFAYKRKHVFSSTNTEAMAWLASRLLHDTNVTLQPSQRFLSVPATNELRNSRRFKQ